MTGTMEMITLTDAQATEMAKIIYNAIAGCIDEYMVNSEEEERMSGHTEAFTDLDCLDGFLGLEDWCGDVQMDIYFDCYTTRDYMGEDGLGDWVYDVEFERGSVYVWIEDECSALLPDGDHRVSLDFSSRNRVCEEIERLLKR